MNREEILEEAKKIVTSDRNKQYGEPEDNEACMNNYAICSDSRPCFAKHYNNTTHRHFCNCLSSVDVPVYKDGDCPFCKPLRYMTNGKEYMTEEERRNAQLKMLDPFPKKVCQ